MNTFEYDVVVVGGLGHIGLPLAIYFADKGLRVCAHDINREYAAKVEAGALPFIEYDCQPVLQRVLANGSFSVSLDIQSVSRARHVVICIGTPVDEYLNPKTKQFLAFFDNLKTYLTPEQTIIVRSSIYPQSCAMMYRRLGGAPWKLAYAPERIVQGYAMDELPKLPQIIAGMTPEAEEEAAQLFAHIAPKIIRTTVAEAELVKLMANAWRYVQFATANQFYMICEQNGVSYERVRHAMRDGYGRAANIPSAGFAAGPCLLKDTMQLSSYSGNTFQLGQAAMMVNEGLPNFLIDRLRQDYDLSQSTVGILGMAFKAEIDDIRDSLSYKLKKVLSFYGATVLTTDEYVPNDPELLPFEQVVAQADILIVGVPHKRYRDYAFPVGKPVIDLWEAIHQGG
jgi:UDP-N-acetyl-D-mannosaminuronic acid dehydrogenase